MILMHFFAHRFRDGAMARIFATYDPETGTVNQQRIGRVELSDAAREGFYEDEFILWTAAIDEFFHAWYCEIKFDEAIAESKDLAHKTYPDLAVKGSPLFQQVQWLMDRFHEDKDSILEDPNGPFRVAEIAAVLVGIEPIK